MVDVGIEADEDELCQRPSSVPRPEGAQVHPPPDDVRDDALSGALGEIEKALDPEDARRRGLQGINSLRLVINRQGQLTAFALASPSGSASLDRATLQLIRRAQPLPAPPPELFDDEQLEVIAPISYSLQRN